MKLKTLSEVKRKKPIDWNARLKQKQITNVEWEKWKKDAGSWVTCACGSQCAIIPREEDGQPVDGILSTRGMDFYTAIVNQDIPDAKNFLSRIEKRSTILIKQELKKLKDLGVNIC